MARRGAVAIGVTLAVLSWCFLYAAATPGPLPSPTAVYSTVVSAGFGDLLFSLHYQEMGNTTSDIAYLTGRYYSPLDKEWFDVPANRYAVTYNNNAGGVTCAEYRLNVVAETRLITPAVFFLSGLISEGQNFTNLGVTRIRTQTTMRYNARFAWSSATGPIPSATLAQFIEASFLMSSVDTSHVYNLNLAVDVYLLSDTTGVLQTVHGGSMPQRFTITGYGQDGSTGAVHNVNIVFDFMQWSALDVGNAGRVLADPNANGNCPEAFGLPTALPQGGLLPATEGPPQWHGSAVSNIELTASNTATQQFYVEHNMQYGEERLDILVDTSRNQWNSLFYIYYFQDERDFRYQNGAVYTVNNSYSNSYYDYNLNPEVCSGAAITPDTVSPLQWTNACQLGTLFADGNDFFAGAVFVGRQVINGITTDAWAVNKTTKYLSTIYRFTVTVYAEANGWANLGRSSLHLTPEIVRVFYNGTAFGLSGSRTPYWVQLDFFTQFFANFGYAQQLDPIYYGCQLVPTNGSVIPPLPSQYSVTISAAFSQYYYSIQYTEYVDTARNLRRVDGRFAPPNTFTLIESNPKNSSTLALLEWNGNVSLAAGFNGYSLFNNVPYTAYMPDKVGTCAAAIVPGDEFSAAATINFFDWLANADPSEAMYTGSFIHRGVECDRYQAQYAVPFVGGQTIYDFFVYYLAADETTTANIPLAAEVLIATIRRGPPRAPIRVQLEFYNFRQVLPPNIFNAPAVSSCSQSAALPGPTPNVARGNAPDPTLAYGDGTEGTKAPTWPTQFSMLIEGQFFTEVNDWNVYTARWYVDFENGRERLDIEPSYNISGVLGVTPVQLTYIYYYKRAAGATASEFAFNNGIVVTYNGQSCVSNALNDKTINPLKQVSPGTLFDSFFPATTKSVSEKTSWGYRDFGDGFFYDDYDWMVNTTFGQNIFTVQSSIFLAIPQWINNPNAVNYTYATIPLGVQWVGTVYDLNLKPVRSDSRYFDLSHYQPHHPGLAVFDAGLYGCPTTPDSPWYNLYGDQHPVISSDSSDSNTSLIVGVVVGVGGGLVLLFFVALCMWKRKGPSNKYAGGSTKSTGGDNELAHVGREYADEHSLNKPEISQVKLVVDGETDGTTTFHTETS